MASQHRRHDLCGTSGGGQYLDTAALGTSSKHKGTSSKRIGTSGEQICTSSKHIGTSSDQIGTSSQQICTSSKHIGTSSDQICPPVNKYAQLANTCVLLVNKYVLLRQRSHKRLMVQGLPLWGSGSGGGFPAPKARSLWDQRRRPVSRYCGAWHF